MRGEGGGRRGRQGQHGRAQQHVLETARIQKLRSTNDKTTTPQLRHSHSLARACMCCVCVSERFLPHEREFARAHASESTGKFRIFGVPLSTRRKSKTG